jgi:Spy/CpxP family protein refolding chaperone
VLSITLAALFFLPPWSLAPAKELNWERFKEQAKIAKDLIELRLSPDKEKALLDLEQKYGQERHNIVASLKQSQAELQAALAGAPQDEAKIKNLVSAVSATQDKLLSVVKMERDEALTLMNPIQQGQFLVMLGNYYQGMLPKAEKKKS